MSCRFRLGFGASLLVLTVPLTGGLTRAAESSVDIAGRKITLQLIQVSNRAPVPTPAGRNKISTQAVRAETGFSISEVLVKRGIYPDSGAYSIVYDLNPHIQDLNKTPAGTRLVLPVVVPGNDWKRKVDSGSFLVAISVDSDIYAQLFRNIASLHQVVPEFLAANRRRAPRSASGDRTDTQVSDVMNWYDGIRSANLRRNGPPTSRYTLLSLVNEASGVEGLLRRVTNGGGDLTAADERQIGAIHRDIEAEIQRYSDMMSGSVPEGDDWPSCTLVAAIDGGNRSYTRKLRVYYTLDGEFHDPPPAPLGSTPFPGLGSGKSDPVRANKTYEVWVSPDGHPDQILTGEHVVTVLRGEREKDFHLLLKTATGGR